MSKGAGFKVGVFLFALTLFYLAFFGRVGVGLAALIAPDALQVGAASSPVQTS